MNYKVTRALSALRLAFLVMLVAAAVIIGFGCADSEHEPKRMPTEESAAAVIFDILDSSASDRPDLPTHVEERGKLALAVDAGSTWLTAIRFDSEAQEIFSGPMPDSDEELLAQLAPALAKYSPHDNTYINLPFTCVADRASHCSGRCVIVMSSDCYGEGMTRAMWEELNCAAQKLADNSHFVAVFIEGANPANMARMRLGLAPLSKKLQFVSSGALDVNLIADLVRTGGVH